MSGIDDGFVGDVHYIENPLGQDDVVGEPNRSALSLRFTASPRETLAPRGFAKYMCRLVKHNRLSH